MFQSTETVLVQFKLPAGVSLPAVVHENEPQTETDRKAKEKSAAGQNLIERHGVIPKGLASVIHAEGLTLVDASAQERINGVGKRGVIVTFTFGKTASVAKQRRDELKGEGMQVLTGLLDTRWGEGRIVKFPGKESLRVAFFAHEVEHPVSPREIDDGEAKSVGFVITRPTKKK